RACFGSANPQAPFSRKRAIFRWAWSVESFLKLLVYIGNFWKFLYSHRLRQRLEPLCFLSVVFPDDPIVPELINCPFLLFLDYKIQYVVYRYLTNNILNHTRASITDQTNLSFYLVSYSAKWLQIK